MAIEFTLQPKQNELVELLERPGVVNIGYGGPRGGGKSRGIRDAMLIRRFKYPHTTGWIVRRTFDEVWDNHIKKYFNERPYTREWYSHSTRTMTLPNGSDLKFRYAEHEGDLQKEYGKEAMDIFVDQGEQFSEEETQFLRTCRRWPGIPDGLCKMVSTINPGGISHEYMNRVFIQRLYQENEIPEQYAFVQASGWDNVEWAMQALAEDGLTVKDYYSWTDDRRFQYFITRTQYGRDLNALPEHMRIQQLLGRWNYFEGQVFPELGKVHDIGTYLNDADDITWRDFHSGFRILGSLDHASTGTTAYGITGIDTDENVFELEEYYRQNRLISEHAQGIKALRAHYKAPDYQMIDPSTEAKTLQNGHEMFSVIDAYIREGLHFIPAHRASIDVGIDLLKQLLWINPLRRNPFTQELGSPRLFISRRRNSNLWREMTALRKENGKYVGSDHAVDRLRYTVMSRPNAAAVKPLEIAKLPTLDQIKIRTEQSFSKKWKEKTGQGTGSWY